MGARDGERAPWTWNTATVRPGSDGAAADLLGEMMDKMVDGALVALGPPTDWPAELVDALGVELTARFTRHFRALTLDERRMMHDTRKQAGAWMAVRMLASGRLRAMPADPEAWYRERVTRSTLRALRVGGGVERAVPDELLPTAREGAA